MHNDVTELCSLQGDKGSWADTSVRYIKSQGQPGVKGNGNYNRTNVLGQVLGRISAWLSQERENGVVSRAKVSERWAANQRRA
jgi:hypothetical protein